MPKSDITQAIRTGLELLHGPSEAFELRVVPGPSHIVPAGQLDKAADYVAAIDADLATGKAIFATLNPVVPALVTNGHRAARAEDISKRRWLFIDVDVVRPKGQNATDTELAKARELADQVREYLHDQGWPAGVLASSGNGWHLLYRIDLVADDRGLCQRVLAALADRFSNEAATVDKVTFDCNRLVRIAGTLNKRNAETPGRPQRRARLVTVPDPIEAVDLALLEAVASQAEGVPAVSPYQQAETPPSCYPFLPTVEGVESWLASFGIMTRNRKRAGPIVWLEIDHDPVNPDAQVQRRGGVGIGVGDDGVLAYKSHHDHASSNFREWAHALDPRVPPPSPRFVRDEGVDLSALLDGLLGGAVYRPFPVELLPQPLRDFVREGSEAMRCDPAFLALPLLAATSGMLGNTVELYLKRGWKALPILWCVVLGRSGSMKSPCQREALQFMKKIQADWLGDYDEARARYDDAMQKHVALLKAWRSRQKARLQREYGEPDSEGWKNPRRDDGDAEPIPPERPSCHRLLVSDTTTEALAAILQVNKAGVLLAVDELSAWISSFDCYRSSGGKDVSNWLSAHQGETWLVDRKTGDQKTIHVPAVAVSVCGGCQPLAFKRVLGKTHIENGLLPRMLLAAPPVEAKLWTDDEISEATSDEMEKLFRRLLSDFRNHDPVDPDSRLTIRMAGEAKQVFSQWVGEVGRLQVAASEAVASCLSKMEEAAGRLALLLYCVQVAASPQPDDDSTGWPPLSADTMRPGVELARWFVGETKRIYAAVFADFETEGPPDEAEADQTLIEWISRRGGQVTARDLQRSYWRKYKTATQAEEALNELVLREWGEWQEPEPTGAAGRKPARSFLLWGADNQTTDKKR